ncbi:MAG: TonB family protein [Prevotella sp.]|nr:TonB family protein [Prevotella sp.]
MIEFLIYDLKVAVLLAIFYMFYRLMLARETFHRVNRIVLLATAIASFVLPLCVITMHETVTMEMDMSLLATDVSTDAITYKAPSEPATPWWQIVLPTLFIIGMVATLGHTLLSLFRIIRMIRHSEQHPQDDGTTICVSANAKVAPFSWMHYIVMNRMDYEAHDNAILTHERGHIRLHHSWDLILVDTLTSLQWFNPAMWMLRSDLRAIHEYEADGVVLSQGINPRQYQYLLITKAASIGGYSLANGISHSTLKNRINMMLHTQSPRRSLLKLLALLPIVAVTLAVNAETVTEYVYDKPQNQVPVKKGNKAGTIKLGKQEIKVEKAEPSVQVHTELKESVDSTHQDVFNVVEDMPQFPGGATKLFEYLAQNINYPTEAEKANIQGRVIVTFVVEKDGSISNAEVVKSVAPSLDAEALRVINAMPNWIPGKQNGKEVRVKYTVPISFHLQGKDANVAQYEGTVKYDRDAKIKPSELVVVGYDSETSQKPLVYVDGKEIPFENMSKVDPKTIDRMDVLKDKQAVDKYGEKAKNGVILITTKKK